MDAEPRAFIGVRERSRFAEGAVDRDVWSEGERAARRGSTRWAAGLTVFGVLPSWEDMAGAVELSRGRNVSP